MVTSTARALEIRTRSASARGPRRMNTPGICIPTRSNLRKSDAKDAAPPCLRVTIISITVLYSSHCRAICCSPLSSSCVRSGQRLAPPSERLPAHNIRRQPPNIRSNSPAAHAPRACSTMGAVKASDALRLCCTI